MQRRAFVGFVLVAIGIMQGAGCGRSGDLPPTVPVTGTVTYQGAPLPNAQVTFYPEGGERPAAGTTDANGAYSLTTFNSNDGAVPGGHTVTVTAYDSSFEGASLTSLIPERYGDSLTSPLQVTVGNERTEIPLDLED